MTSAAMRRDALAAVVLLVLMVVAAIVLAGASPVAVVSGVAERALMTRTGLLEALLRTIPLTIMGLGIALAFRARVFNIGMDGQLIAGSVLAVAAASWLPANAAGLMLFLALGILGGAFWGGLAGFIKARFGGNEIIVTIMLNYIAIQLLSWLVRGPMQESMKIIPRTDAIDRALRLPIIFEGTRVHVGIFIALVLGLAVALLAQRSRFGFKLDVVGANEHAARYAGIGPRRIGGLVLLLSGAFGGLAGAVEISGLYGRLQEGFAPGFGITAIAVALVARLNPLLVPLSAFLFSLLYVGLGSLARNGAVPFPLINILEGTVILLFLAGSIAFGRRRQVAEPADG